MSFTPKMSAVSLRRTVRLAVLLLAASIPVVLVSRSIFASDSDQVSTPVASPSLAIHEETRNLTGEDLAQALGLEPLPIERGVVFSNEDPRLGQCRKGSDLSEGTAFLVDTPDGYLYCVAGIARNELEAFDLAWRLAGHMPCDLEIEAFLLDQRADDLEGSGAIEEAKSLWSEAHDLRSRAYDECWDKASDPAS